MHRPRTTAAESRTSRNRLLKSAPAGKWAYETQCVRGSWCISVAYFSGGARQALCACTQILEGETPGRGAQHTLK